MISSLNTDPISGNFIPTDPMVGGSVQTRILLGPPVEAIDTQPDQSQTTAQVVDNLEQLGAAAINQAAPDTINVIAPNGAYPYNPADPANQGLPNGTGITVQIGQQQKTNSNMALLLVVVVLCAILGEA